MQQGINKARAVAIFIGREGLGSWQKREMGAGLDRQARDERAGNKFPVVPVLLPGADMEGAPGFLLLNTWVDLRDGVNDSRALDTLASVVRGEVVRPPQVTSAALCPYRSLLAFREEDAPLFFGREIFARELLNKALGRQLVAVVGHSGSGKSSVVQAGLLPLLRHENSPPWDVVIFTPGRNPFHSLAAALTRLWDADKTGRLVGAAKLGESWSKGIPLEPAINQALNETLGASRLLMVVDQFEELFTLTPETERLPFVNALLEVTASTPVTILATLRADFYCQAISLSRELSDRIQRGLVNLGPMKRDELQRAIENPAEAVGLGFEAGLVNRILDNVANQPGNLPILEFALTELWKKREGRLLTNACYDEIGGISGAISKRAEEVFENLSGEQQAIAQHLLTRIVRVAAFGEEDSDTRHRAETTELDATMRSVAQPFITARLLVVDRNPLTNKETIEVAHEALIQRWERLRELLNRDREFLSWRQRFRLRFTEWKHAGESDGGALLGGAPLAEARHWLKERQGDFIEDERDYINTSIRRDLESLSWRSRIDTTVSWAIITAGATLAFAFSSPANPPFFILAGFILAAFFLFVAPDTVVKGRRSIWPRLRRNYLPISTVLAAGWALKVYLHPVPATHVNDFISRAGIDLIPGQVVLISVLAFNIALSVVALLTYDTRGGNEVSGDAGRGYLDTTTNGAIVAAGVTLGFAFSSPITPHFIILISSVLIAVFLIVSDRSAFRRRLWRNYLPMFILLIASWFLKIYIHPFPVNDFGVFAGRAAVGVIPGEAVLFIVAAYVTAIFVFAFAAIRLRGRKGQDTEEESDAVLLQDVASAEATRTTNWAIITAGAGMAFTFASPANPHFIIMICYLLVAFFLFITPSATMSEWWVIRGRLRRSYLPIFILLASGWVFKVYIHPLPAYDFGEFVDRATLAVVPGEIIISLIFILNTIALFIALAPFSVLGMDDRT